MKKLLCTVCVALGLGAFLPAGPATAQEPFVGQIIYFPYNFCPRNFAEASGQLLPISQNTALFSLYGTIYGGDGRTTMGLPDLRGRAPMNFGRGPGLSSYQIGQRVGAPSAALSVAQVASHNHSASVTGSTAVAGSTSLAGNALGTASYPLYAGRAAADATLTAGTGTTATQGGGQAMNLMQPYLTVRPCVALVGIYPSRS